PVVSTYCGSAVGTASGVLVVGTGAPDLLAGAMHFGIVASPDVIAIPDPVGGLFDKAGDGTLQDRLVPGTVLGEGFQRFPVLGSVQVGEGLGDGVFVDVEGQSGDPLGEAVESGCGEGRGAGLEQVLPVGPEQRSLHGHLPCWRTSAH